MYNIQLLSAIQSLLQVEDLEQDFSFPQQHNLHYSWTKDHTKRESITLSENSNEAINTHLFVYKLGKTYHPSYAQRPKLCDVFKKW